MVVRDLRDFTIINDELYSQCGVGAMVRALSMAEAKEELQHIHELSCGDKPLTMLAKVMVQLARDEQGSCRARSVCPSCEGP